MAGKNRPSSSSGGMAMDKKQFDSLDGYEKGVAARVLLRDMIKQGLFDERLEDDKQIVEIIVPVQHWQLQLLACFREESGPEETISERIHEAIRHLR